MTTVKWTKGCVINHFFVIYNGEKSLIFEKKGESCSEGYKEYEWINNEWTEKTQCATDNECKGNDPNKHDKNNLEFFIILYFFFFLNL